MVNFAPDSHRLANDICMDGCVNSKVAMNNSYGYTKYILWFLLCASVTQMLNIISITITVSDRLTLCTIAWHFPWKEMQFYLQVSSTNFDRAMFSRSIFYYITKQLQHVQIYRATEVFTAVQDWHFVVQCSKNCRLMQLFSNEVYLIHIVCEVWPSLEASPGRIQSVAGRLGQLTATRGINQIIHENEFPFWYWVNYYYYLGSTTRATMLSNNNNNNNTMLLCCLDFCFVKS